MRAGRRPLRHPGILWLLIATVVALLVVACGGQSGGPDDPGAAGVRDFSEVQVGETPIEILEGGTVAIISLTTDPETVCAVAFGETDELGRIANDPSMGGSAIREHAVVLTDLTPETTYRYRLTATDAQGQIYQSPELLTFTTQPSTSEAAQAEVPGTNVAADAAVIEASSEFNDAFTAANALDGDISTEWSTAGDGDNAFVTIDLGKPLDVTGVAFRTRAMSDGSAITSQFMVVVDEGERFGPFQAGDRRARNVAAVEFSGQILRFEVDESTGGNTGAVDVEVYTDAASAG